jgi:hypothetical protein
VKHEGESSKIKIKVEKATRERSRSSDREQKASELNKESTGNRDRGIDHWAKVDMDSKKKNKFLRLMGATKSEIKSADKKEGDSEEVTKRY